MERNPRHVLYQELIHKNKSTPSLGLLNIERNKRARKLSKLSSNTNNSTNETSELK